MNKQYTRNINNNYLILNDNDCTSYTPDYTVKMLMYNEIAGLLPVKISYTNQNPSFSYKITGLQPLSSLFNNRKIKYNDFFNIITSLKILIESMDSYILNPDYIILSPDLIFCDPEDVRLSFCYYPLSQSNFHNDFKNLMAFLLNHIDHNDNDCILWAYGIQQASLKENLSYLQILDEQINVPTNNKFETIDKPLNPIPELSHKNDVAHSNISFDLPPNEMEREKKVLNLKPGIPYAIGTFFSFIVSILNLLDLIIFKKLPSLYSAFLLITSLTCLMYFIMKLWNIRGELLEIKIVKTTIPNQVTLDELTTSNTLKPITKQGNEDSISFTKTIKDSSSQISSENLGRTVLLYTEDESSNNIQCNKDRGCELLYSGNDGYEDIIISKFPYTIGKLASSTDFILNNPSISRVHARIDYDWSSFQYTVTDLNSTNGTFINDKPLAPNTSYDIKPGDVISFARVSYLFNV